MRACVRACARARSCLRSPLPTGLPRVHPPRALFGSSKRACLRLPAFPPPLLCSQAPRASSPPACPRPSTQTSWLRRCGTRSCMRHAWRAPFACACALWGSLGEGAGAAAAARRPTPPQVRAYSDVSAHGVRACAPCAGLFERAGGAVPQPQHAGAPARVACARGLPAALEHPRLLLARVPGHRRCVRGRGWGGGGALGPRCLPLSAARPHGMRLRRPRTRTLRTPHTSAAPSPHARTHALASTGALEEAVAGGTCPDLRAPPAGSAQLRLPASTALVSCLERAMAPHVFLPQLADRWVPGVGKGSGGGEEGRGADRGRLRRSTALHMLCCCWAGAAASHTRSACTRVDDTQAPRHTQVPAPGAAAGAALPRLGGGGRHRAQGAQRSAPRRCRHRYCCCCCCCVWPARLACATCGGSCCWRGCCCCCCWERRQSAPTRGQQW